MITYVYAYMCVSNLTDINKYYINTYIYPDVFMLSGPISL